jgi:hypothetical protein
MHASSSPLEVPAQYVSERWKMRKFTKTLILAFGLCFAISYAAKADSFTGTPGTGSVTFTGVDVYDVNSNSASNPYGLTQVTCPGGGACGANLGGSFEVASITFFSDGGFVIRNTANAPNGDSEGAWENGTAPGTSIFTVSGATLGSLVAHTSETANPSSFPMAFCPSVSTPTGWCFNGTDQGGDSVLTYQGTVSGISGVFTASDNSEEVAFNLTSISSPEPSSLLMLGSGLLGLFGLGFRRKGRV